MLCPTAGEQVAEPATAVNLDNLGMRVVLTRCLLEELPLVVRGALTARYLRDQVRLDEAAVSLGPGGHEGVGVSIGVSDARHERGKTIDESCGLYLL